MKKIRIVSLAMAMIMSASLFAGCGENGEKASETKTSEATASVEQKPVEAVTLKIWGGVPAEKGPDLVCENFNKEFETKGIKAVYERFVNDANGNLKLDTALMAGEDVDIFVNYSLSNLKKRTTSNATTDLTPYFQKDNFDPEKEIGPIVKEYYVDGKPVSLPTNLNPNNTWMINKDMFDAAGIPIPTDWTIDDLKDIAKKLTKGESNDKVFGIMFATDNDKQAPLSLVATMFGGDYLFKNEQGTESNFDSPDLLRALKTVTDMMLVEKTAVAHADVITQKLVAVNLFAEGKVAIIPHIWSVRDLKDTTNYPHTFKTAFVPAPKMNKDQKDYYAAGGVGDFFSISSKSSKKDQAWEYLKWYATKGMVDMIPGGRMPAYKGFDPNVSVAKFLEGAENLFDKKSFTDNYIKLYDKYQVSHIQNKLPELLQVAREECEKVMSGAIVPEEGLKSAKTRGDALLK